MMYIFEKILSLAWFLVGGYLFLTAENISDPQTLIGLLFVILAYISSIDVEVERIRKDR